MFNVIVFIVVKKRGNKITIINDQFNIESTMQLFVFLFGLSKVRYSSVSFNLSILFILVLRRY